MEDKKPRSVSQYNEYKRCPYAFYLNRVENVWQRPAAWLPQGLGVHEAAEEFEKSGRTMDVDETKKVFVESYVKHTNRLSQETPNLEYWFASGPYRGAVDIERRFGIGLSQVESYLGYYQNIAPDEVIWVADDGTPGIELGFEIDLDGVPVRGFIDQVIASPDHPTPVVRDIKTGNNPGDVFQLATYAVAVNELYGTEISTGDYWMGRKGKPTRTYDLSMWTRDAISAEFSQLDENVKAERFDPLPEDSKCRFCPVSASCPFFYSNT